MPSARRSIATFLTFAIAVAVTTDGAAAEQRARIDAIQPPGLKCPGAPAIREAIAARLGYDPYRSDADRIVLIRFDRRGKTVRATVTLSDASGALRGERVLSSGGGDCQELASAVAVTVSIMLDPHAGLGERPHEKENPESAPPPAVMAPPAPAPPDAPPPQPAKVEEDAALHGRATLAAFTAVGAAPVIDPGVLLDVGIRLRWVSVSAELRADLPVSATRNAAEIRVGYAGGGLVPCGHYRAFHACVVGSFGSLRGEVRGSQTVQQSTFHAFVGPRVGLSLPVLPAKIAFIAELTGLYAPTTTTLRVAGREIWTTPPLSVLADLGVRGELP